MGQRADALVAAIDLGTNAFRLLVGTVTSEGRVTTRHVYRVIPRLGEGVGQTGRLTAGAMTRAVDALREMRAIVDRHPVDAVVAVATSAVREAANADEFLKRVKEEVGLDVEVISGDEEARRTWLGVRTGFATADQPVTDAFIVDIGGGSTEVIRVRDGRFDRALSLDLGVVKLSERCVHHDPPLDAELRALDSAARDALRVAAMLRSGDGPRHVVGTAGTVTAAAVLHLGLTRYEPALVHDRVVPRAAIGGIASRLARMTGEERRQLPSLERGREDVVLAGLAILAGVLDLFEAQEVRVSEYGLREGLVVDWAERNLVGRRRETA
jgi:exopolyphosphatase/guanosine-5'-triphosphate,3'-diphosphate pyrophosphatase